MNEFANLAMAGCIWLWPAVAGCGWLWPAPRVSGRAGKFINQPHGLEHNAKDDEIILLQAIPTLKLSNMGWDTEGYLSFVSVVLYLL